MKFSMTTEFSVLMFLIAHIVRGTGEGYVPPGAARIHKHFFKKGMLCASYSEKDIAKFFGWKSKAYVSRIVHNLERMNMLHIKKIPTPIGKRNVYQLGFYEGTYGKDGYKETLFFDVYFSGLSRIHEARKVEDRIQEFMGDCSDDYLDQINGKIISLDEKRQNL